MSIVFSRAMAIGEGKDIDLYDGSYLMQEQRYFFEFSEVWDDDL